MHLASELSMEFRSLRKKDAVALCDKFSEVDNLENEVVRLAGKVVVLSGVVEEVYENDEGPAGKSVFMLQLARHVRLQER